MAAEAETGGLFKEKAFFQMAIARIIVALHKGNAKLSQLGLVRTRLSVARVEVDPNRRECAMCNKAKEHAEFDYVLHGCTCTDIVTCFECMFQTVTTIVSKCYICNQERTAISIQPGISKNVVIGIDPIKGRGDDEDASMFLVRRLGAQV